MRSVGAFDAKTHLAALLDAVSAGEQITITRHGRPVARLVAATIAHLHGFCQGQTLEGIAICSCPRAIPLALGNGDVLVQAEQRGRISAAAIRTFLGLLENLPISIDQPNFAAA